MTRMTADEFRKRVVKKKPIKPVPELREIQERAALSGYKPPYQVMEDHPRTCALFFLPLELCCRQNQKFGVKPWQAKSDRRKVYRFMYQQCVPWIHPLEGRPLVRCIRFSSVEPDKYADWAKVAVDCLCAPIKRAQHRLNIIKDDAPKYAEIEQIWRKAKPGEGFCVIEVWTGVE